VISEERLLSTAEVGERMGVDEQTVRLWIKKGKLEALKVGRGWRIPRSALEAFLENAPKARAPRKRPELSAGTVEGSEEERRHSVRTREAILDWETVLEALATRYRDAEREFREAEPGVFPNEVIDVAVDAGHHLRLLSREADEVREAPGVVAAEKRVRCASASVERMINQFLNPMDEAHVEQSARFKRAAARGGTASYASIRERKGSDDSAQSAS
jgi:excisionase family DNA binding protein